MKTEDSTETLSSNLQSSQSAGGIDDPKKKSCGIFNLKRKRLPSVRPSILSIHPYCPSIHPSFPFIYISIYLAICSPIYLPIYLTIFRSIHLSNYILSDNVAILGLHVIENSRKNNLQSKEGHRGYRQTRSIEKPPNRL